MKRFLKNNRYQQSDREAETMWYRIRGELAGRSASPSPRHPVFRPALGVVASVAVLVMAGSWWFGEQRVEQRILPTAGEPAARGQGPVVALRSDQAPEKTTEADSPQKVESAPAPAEGAVAADLPVAPGSLNQDVDVADRLATAKEEVLDRDDAAKAGRREQLPEPAASTAMRAPAPATVARIAATASRQGIVTGRVVDKVNGEGLSAANILITGTARSAMTDSTGAFRLTALEPGRRYDLQILRLDYAPLDVAVTLPDTGVVMVACELEPVVLQTLAWRQAENDDDLEAVMGIVPDRKVDSPQVEKRAVESVEEALRRPTGGSAGSRDAASQRHEAATPSTVMPRKRVNSPSEWGRIVDVRPQRRIMPTPPGSGSVTGGTRPPNGETYELMYFEHTGVNPFVSTDEDALSTFALDVDNASFTVARSYLERGVLPPRDAIRVEEFVNALDAGWPRQHKGTFGLHVDGSPSRFGRGYHLLRVGVVGRTVAKDRRKPANLVFVIDVSGSMNRESRLGSVKHALRMLVDELGEGDRVGIVIYGSRGEIRLPLTDISRRSTILGAIEALQPDGSTNAAEGLELGYRLARENYEADAVNRLILCSDGVANTGSATSAEGILSLVRRASDQGITLSTVGFGMGNYNDVLMEKLADQGDGNYFYVDKPAEAERVFRENLTGMLQTIARETKVQVEFDPRVVTRWRLLGYENRDVADRDFRNDAVDAGEVGAGHQVTALYEVKLANPPETVAVANIGRVDEGPAVRAGTVRLRWEAPAHDTDHAGEVTEIEQVVLLSAFAIPEKATSPRRRAQILAVEFAEILRGSYWAKGSQLVDLVPVAVALARDLPDDNLVQDLARMIRQAADLQAEAPDRPRPAGVDQD